MKSLQRPSASDSCVAVSPSEQQGAGEPSYCKPPLCLVVRVGAAFYFHTHQNPPLYVYIFIDSVFASGRSKRRAARLSDKWNLRLTNVESKRLRGFFCDAF